MNRRGFLNSIAAAVGAGLLVPELARELILPERTIVLPPLGGWPHGNTLIDVDLLAREMLRVLAANLQFTSRIDWHEQTFDGEAYRQPITLTICRPRCRPF